MTILLRSLTLLLFAHCSIVACSQPGHLEMRLALAPELVLIGGKPTAYMEYFVTNSSNDTLYLQKLEVRQGAAATVIASLGRDALTPRTRRAGSSVKTDGTVMPPGTTSILYLELVVETQKPKEHFVAALTYEHNGKAHTFRTDFDLDKKTPLVLGAPLREGNWAAVYDPSWERGHRRVFYKSDSGMHLPGRYAIDFIRLDAQGRYTQQNEDEIRHWYGYGAEVLAVSDGTVLSIRNDFPESTTLSAHRQPAQDHAAGNYISLEVGKERVVFYEHLRPGSIRVQPGQKVKKGDVIAALGFTGQSTGPHLHFHVADRNSPLHAEGIPFVFERFGVLGVFTDMEKFGKEVWSPVRNPGQLLQQERPAPNAVIVFR